jgi:PAS domain S-box-containing protein
MLIPSERLAEAEHILARVHRGEHVEGVETERRTKDGRCIDVSLTISPVWNFANEIVATSAIVRDITERKATERALAASEAILRVAFDNAPIGMILISPDQRTLQVNRALCEMLGYTVDELLATSFWAFTHPEDIDANRILTHRALSGEIDRYAMEKRYLHRDGHIIWAHLSGSLTRDVTGQPLYFISQIQEITDRKAAEVERTETHHHTRQVLERITDGFYALDREFRFTYVNDAAERMLGRTREEVLHQNVWEAFAPAVETPLYTAYQEAMNEGTTRTVEFFYPPLNCWFEVRVYPSADGLSVFFRDITARTRLQQELRDSETKYRTLIDHLPAVVYAVAEDEAQTRLYFSPRHEELTGYSVAETLARTDSWVNCVHPDDRARVAEENARSEAASDSFRAEYRHLRKDGSYVWVQDECVPVRDDSEKIISWQGVLLDITERIQAEEGQARLAAVVAWADDAVISSTLDGTITSWNQGAERHFGYPAEEMIGQSFTMLLPDNLVNPELEQCRAAVTSGMAAAASLETTRQRRDGSIFAASVALSPIRDRNGRIVGVSSITRDITTRKRAEELLRAALEGAQAATRTKSLFLAMMSHELRTPLQAVLGYTDFLLLAPAGSLTAGQVEDLGYIHAGATRMTTLIDQLLDLSRMEAGRLELAHEAVDLSQIIEQVRQDVAPQVGAKGLELIIDLPSLLPCVIGDPVRMRQILLNLVGNSVKFTEVGSVRITARGRDAGVDVAVWDTGIGISEEALPLIFEEFRQVDGDLSRRYGGAGLGLAIAHKLAEQMGGSIRVESQPQHGSTFTVHFAACQVPVGSVVAQTWMTAG